MDKHQTKLLKLFAFLDRIPAHFTVNDIIQKLSIGFRICVPIFIIVTGYGFGKRMISNEITMSYCLNKVLQFYLIYWFIMVITLPYGFISGANSLDNFSIFEILGFTSNYNREWWFVGLYILLLLFLPLFKTLFKKGKGAFIIVTTFIYIVGLVLPQIGISNLTIR